MSIATEVLRRLDPRKSYDRGPWSGQPEALPPTPPTHGIASLSTAELQRELERRATAIDRLKARREQIVAELASVDTAITELTGGEAGAGPRRPARHVVSRPKNSLTLADAIAAAVEPGQQVSPAEVADLVRQGGWLTSSKSFAQAVAVALGKHSRFRRIGRGQYQRVG